MALTKVSLVDLNAGELILDLDADTSITSDTDDTIHFKIGGSDEITITGTALSPSTSDGNALGTSALEWSDLFLADGAVINFGDDQDVSLTHVADTGLLLSSTDQLQFGDSGTYIHQSADGVLDLVSDTEIEINATTIDVNGNLDVSGTIVGAGALTAATSITVGSAVLTEAELETLDGVTVGTAIASKVVTTDANIDTTGQRNLTITGELDAATGDFSGDVDIDGTANLDTVDIDGATQIDATVTVGVDDTGYDVKFFGDTSGAHMLWDASVDDLILAGAARLVVPEGNLVLGSTAVTSTAAELNLLDGVSGLVQADLTKLAAIDATATEINFIDGGATVGTTAVADGDGIIHNDGGTMKVTSAATFKTYFQQGISTAYDDLTAGDAAVLITTSSGNITIDAAANDSDIILKGTDGNADTTFLTIDGSAAGEATFNAGIVIADAGTIGSASDKDAIAIGSDGDVTLTQDLELQHDGAILSFGANDEVTLTHVHDTGILLNSTNVIQFNDASQNIGAPSNAILDINATDEIELNATLVDVNANVEISGTASVGGVLTTSAAISGSTAEFSGAVTVQGAFLVNEDSADVDTRIESNGNANMFFVDGGNDMVIIGNNAPISFDAYGTEISTQILGAGTAPYTGLGIVGHTNDADCGVLILGKSRGTSVGSATVVQDGDQLGRIEFQGMDGTDLETGASILAVVDGTPGADDMPAELVFRTTADGAHSATERLAIKADGTSNFSGRVEVNRSVGSNATPATSGNTQVNTVFELSGVGNQRLYVGTDTGDNTMWFQNNNPGSLDINYALNLQANGGIVYISKGNAADLRVGNFVANGTGQGVKINSDANQGAIIVETNLTTARNLIHFVNGNGTVGTIQTSSSATSYNTSSDYRLKENVDYTWDATTRLKQLKPARFNFKVDDTNTLVDGFLAHEVSSVVPEAISGEKDAVDDDDNAVYQGIDQSKLVPLLVKTIQELEARITALEG